MPLVWQIWIALALDFLLGDPRWLPHPVRIIGRCALYLESPARQLLRNERMAGILTAIVVVAATAMASFGLLLAARSVSPLAGDILSIWMLYTALAARDLGAHGRRVLRALEDKDLPGARMAVSHMVGRDTAGLDESGVVRAAVESVAENSVDGVLGPLFFAFMFGPVGAMAYKAASTLDSTFGYKNDRYLRFGWASARLDDALNLIPARLGMAFISIGAVFTGNRPGRALAMGLRDARKHASPNAGFPEAAFAGALGIQLGGPVLRDGVPADAPLLGDADVPLRRRHISRANALMTASVITAALLLTFARLLLEKM
jgi:adenosylcobinamide-phosphate synthase